jgi:hypothetical protein
MSIEYVEIRNENTELLGIVDTAKSIIWHSVYFGVGDFEIYVQPSREVLSLLQAGNLVTRPDDLEVGIIEKINIDYDPHDGQMVTATGRFAKCLLERRLIYKLSGTVNTPTILRGNVEEAVRGVVLDNAINCAWDSRRNIPLLELGDTANIPQRIVDSNGNDTQKQVSYQNLLEYTDELLQEFGLGSTVIMDSRTKRLRYVIYAGIDHSWSNDAGNDPIIFSEQFDNMTSSGYEYNAATEKNAALIGGAGEGLERFYSLLAGTEKGLQRREIFVDAASLNRTYKDENDEEKTYGDSEYKAMLDAAGTQQLNANNTTETFGGAIDIQNSQWQYNRDFALGDIVTIQDDNIGKYVNVRLREVLEVQDENGYTIEANNRT